MQSWEYSHKQSLGRAEDLNQLLISRIPFAVAGGISFVNYSIFILVK